MRIRSKVALFAGISICPAMLIAAKVDLPDTNSVCQSFDRVIKTVGSVTPVTLISNQKGQAVVALSPVLQGRVLTSTADGLNGCSFGWVNESLISSRRIQKHFNPYGGEDRVWIAPEGGQFSVFFAPKTSFDLAHWFTPAPLDTEPFQVVQKSKSSAELRKSFYLLNYSGTRFHVRIEREIRMLPRKTIFQDLKLPKLTNIRVVGFQSRDTLTNIGSNPWSKRTGLLSLWVIGEFPASPETTVVVPIRSGSENRLGRRLTSDYFGVVPINRLSVRANLIFFKADSAYRSKIGVSPARATGVLGSYDARHHILTVVQYVNPPGNQQYANNTWKIQKNPYQGDVENVYNDGPPPSGGPQLGNFYELESLSPVKPLSPGQAVYHIQRTFHFQGRESSLNEVAVAVLGVRLDEIRTAIPR